MTWYHGFILAVIALRFVATPRDRNALSVVLVASFVSILLVHFVTHEITAPWKLAIPGAIETLTIVAMLKWSANRTGFWQVAYLVIAWLAHVLCYVDVVFNTDLVYSNYETIIKFVAIGQIIAFHETITHSAGTCRTWFYAFLDGSAGGFRTAGLRNSVLRDEGDDGFETPQ